MTNEKDDLDSLLTSPGWLRVVNWARTEWADGYPAKVKMAIMKAKEQGSDIAAAVEAVDAAADAVNALLSWPSNRLRGYEMAAELPEPTMTRGGY